MYEHKEPELIKKVRIIKNCFERLYVILVCLLWIAATCWDIYKLQRYWFDYALELYSTVLIFITLLFSISPKAISYNIYNSFKMITKIKGRGILFIIISLLFIRDKFDFHKFCSFVLLIAGVLCFICELLIPTTKEEIERIAEIYEKNIIKNKTNNDLPIFNSMNELRKNEEEKNGNEIIISNNDNEKNEEKPVEIKIDNDLTSEDNNIKNFNNEIVPNNQSTNPYDLPDDF